MNHIAILLVNTGSPAEPTPQAVKTYLSEFLSDPYVVDLPAFLWKPFLNGVLLHIRPQRSAGKYRQIWNENGSPLVHISRQLTIRVEEVIKQHINPAPQVILAMRYGCPSIAQVLSDFHRQGIRKIIVLPLFPQYSKTTSGTILAEVKRQAGNMQIQPVEPYFAKQVYLDTLTDHLHNFWAQTSIAPKVLFSFHGIPQRMVHKGDPYEQHCLQTAQSLAARLNLSREQWGLGFQSRFGHGKWLQPTIQDTLHTWIQSGVRHVQIFPPGFAVDCLETLYELNIELTQAFQIYEGLKLEIIPALNDSQLHAEMVAKILLSEFQTI
ncbi:MAG: ferrochelatase [Chloroflexi bacterium HGW-Chloroflexi-10]|nr:MAG: ferrochelatase [Chloroflexi bacterium HGW-Chloroflexi-10]